MCISIALRVIRKCSRKLSFTQVHTTVVKYSTFGLGRDKYDLNVYMLNIIHKIHGRNFLLESEILYIFTKVFVSPYELVTFLRSLNKVHSSSIMCMIMIILYLPLLGNALLNYVIFQCIIYLFPYA